MRVSYTCHQTSNQVVGIYLPICRWPAFAACHCFSKNCRLSGSRESFWWFPSQDHLVLTKFHSLIAFVHHSHTQLCHFHALCDRQMLSWYRVGKARSSRILLISSRAASAASTEDNEPQPGRVGSKMCGVVNKDHIVCPNNPRKSIGYVEHMSNRVLVQTPERTTEGISIECAEWVACCPPHIAHELCLRSICWR